MSASLRIIESTQNPQAKRWIALTTARGIRKFSGFILSGRKTVPEALNLYAEHFESIISTSEDALNELAIASHINRYIVSRALFDLLDTNGTGFPLLVGQLPDMRDADLSSPPEGLELVCGLGDPSNLGAVLRSAAAFGVSRIILLESAAHPFHPKALRGGANAQFRMRFLRGGNWENFSKAHGPVVALDGNGDDMRLYDWPHDLRLVLGEEGPGVPAWLHVGRLAIKTTGHIESLNATVAASIALHSWFMAQGS